jgi:hypothetical protein
VNVQDAAPSWTRTNTYRLTAHGSELENDAGPIVVQPDGGVTVRAVELPTSMTTTITSDPDTAPAGAVTVVLVRAALVTVVVARREIAIG